MFRTTFVEGRMECAGKLESCIEFKVVDNSGERVQAEMASGCTDRCVLNKGTQSLKKKVIASFTIQELR